MRDIGDEIREDEEVEVPERREVSDIERPPEFPEWVKTIFINLLVAASICLAKAALDYLVERYRTDRYEPHRPYYSW